MENTNKLATNRLFLLIIQMAVPSIFSMFIQSMYNIVDSIFVAMLSTEALTATSIAYPIQNLILAITVGFGTGLNAFLARNLGRKNYKQANQAASLGLLMSIVHYLIVLLLSLFLAKPFLSLFSDNLTTIDLAYQYIMIVCIFSFSVFIHITIEKVFQACGSMVEPMLFQLLGSIVNLILDPIFIFGWGIFPAMGIRGAAIATVIGQAVSMMIAIYVYRRKKLDVQFQFKQLQWNGKMLKEIYTTSIPSFLLLSIGSVMVSCLNYLLKAFSEVAVLAFGIYFRLQTFVFMPINGLVQGTLPIMSFSYGAKQKERLLDCLKISLALTCFFSILGTIIFQMFPETLLMLFNSSPEVLSVGVPALRIISLSFFFAGFGYVFTSYFQATRSPLFSVFIILGRQLLILVPLAMLLGQVKGLNGFWWAFIATEAIVMAMSFILLKLDLSRKSIYKMPVRQGSVSLDKATEAVKS